MSVIWFLLIGAVAGWLAGLIMKGGGFGLVGNMVVGVLGSVIGGYLFDSVGVSAGNLLTALIGALVLLFLVGLLRRGR
ncbi:GlsB/YeaQ/YmgE family stress response membrane protein [Perlucidibaca piscinae]|uniref:GlsB/YeaQ/YmgE family stress response membrane protein n=1 Tax=Perlucidibaca piscinae TaxID=392589 RepID=UPI00047D0A65|nr:GlsB/YeaQ/YmgE family stress response membrane protein [Perlucidibaca piscinae]